MTLQNTLNRRKGISNTACFSEQVGTGWIVGYSGISVAETQRTRFVFGSGVREGKNHCRHCEPVDKTNPAGFGLKFTTSQRLPEDCLLSLMETETHPNKKESSGCLCGFNPAHKRAFCGMAISLPAESCRVRFKKNVLKANIN